MRKNISLVILSNSGSSVKQLTMSTTFLRVFVIACVISLGIFGYDYYHLKATNFSSLDSSEKLSSASDEIVRQRQQIQDFAGEIAELKSKLRAK